MVSELVRLPKEFVEDCRREAQERGVPIGRVVTDRAKWSRSDQDVEKVREIVDWAEKKVAVKVDARREMAMAPGPEAFCDHRWERGVSGMTLCTKCKVKR